MARDKDLVQLIRDNPGAIFTVDNDCWWMRAAPPKPFDEMTEAENDAYWDSRLADDNDVIRIGDGGYGSGNCYGGDILQALAVIAGVTIESV